MDFLVAYFDSIGLDFWQLLTTAGILLAGTILFGAIGRFVFGKRSMFVNSVSSAIGILFIYALNVVLNSAGVAYQRFMSPLPFIQMTGDNLYLFSFYNADYTIICSELLSMIILAFLVNLVDRWMPTGKNVLTWTIFRVLTVALAQAAHILVAGLITTYLPEGLLTYAPVILLAILVLMLLTGALKILVGVILSTVNPLIAALYTFFFANVVGKQITKAVFTTVILTGLVLALQYFGITAISIALSALVAYVPILIILLILWYIVHKIF